MMDRLLLALSLGLVAPALLPLRAEAGPQCAPHDTVARQLADQFGEARRALGLAQDSTMMELFAAEGTGTWTLTVTLPNGLTCLVAAGSDFRILAEPLPARGDPA
jgi:hypothetical protein